MAGYFYDDGGSATAPYDTWAKATTTLAAIIAGGLVAGEKVWIGNDTAGEALGVSTIYTFPGTAANPNFLTSVTKNTPPDTLSAGAIISTAGTNLTLSFSGSFYMWGVIFNIATGVQNNVLVFGTLAGNKVVVDGCSINFNGNNVASRLYLGSAASYIADHVILKNTALSFANVSQGIVCNAGKVLIDNLTVLSAITGLIKLSTGASNVLIQNSNLSSCARGLVIFPATTSQIVARFIIRNSKLPASWNGTLVTGGEVTGQFSRAEMYNCDSADTNYRILINDYYGQLQSETTLVATGGATDGTTRLSWKIVTTANANKVNPFECPEITAWNDTEGTQRKCTVEIIHSAAALLTDSEAWLEVDASTDTTDPLYAKSDDRTADLVITAPANQDASTTAWDDLVTARQNSHAYVLNDIIKSTANPGRVFICTTAGTSAGSEPAGYGSAVDGGTVADGVACVFTAMWRQKLIVTLPTGKPANKGCLIGTIKFAKASLTVYADPFMKVGAV